MPYINLPIDMEPLGIGASNDITFYCLTQRGRLDSKGADEWTVLQFTEHSVETGSQLSPGPIAKYKLNGKVHVKSKCTKAIAISPSKLVFAVAVTEGSVGQEVEYLHGYTVQMESLRSKVTQVFRKQIYDDAASIILDEQNRLYITCEKTVLIIDTDSWDELATIPFNLADVQFFSAYNGNMYGLLDSQTGYMDKLCIFNLKIQSVKWIDISPDPQHGFLSFTQVLKPGALLQHDSAVLVYCQGFFWELDVGADVPAWQKMTEIKEPNSNTESFDLLTTNYDASLIFLAQNTCSGKVLKIDCGQLLL